MEMNLDFFVQFADATEEGKKFVEKVKDYEPPVVFGVMAAMVDAYCITNGLDAKKVWEEMYEAAMIMNS